MRMSRGAAESAFPQPRACLAYSTSARLSKGQTGGKSKQFDFPPLSHLSNIWLPYHILEHHQ
jgi:hypothetical protein